MKQYKKHVWGITELPKPNCHGEVTLDYEGSSVRFVEAVIEVLQGRLKDGTIKD